jgi:hypothetical protein
MLKYKQYVFLYKYTALQDPVVRYTQPLTHSQKPAEHIHIT